MWSGCLGDIEWGMCGVRDPLGNALKMVKKHIKSAEKSNNQNGWCGIKQSKSHKYHFPIPLVFRIKTIKIPEKSREMDNTVEKVEKVDNVETLRLSCARGYSPLSLRPCRRVLCEPCVHL
jgi:hypothetical protein